MNVIANLFPGFAEHRSPTEDAEIFVRTGGSGPPLLLHGIPRPTCAGTRSRQSWRGTSRWCLPTCAATAAAPRRWAMLNTRPTPSGAWRRSSSHY